MIGYDYTDRIDPAALVAANCEVVFRYLSNPGWPKNLTAPEARELLAAGRAVVLNYETSATFMLGGYSAGVTCARSARQQANDLGAPSTAKIFYSADFDASPSQISILMDFLRGAASVDGAAQVGLYGGLRAVQAAASAGFATWQTIAWSGGQWDSRAAARQTGRQYTIGGAEVDENEIIDLTALGAWTSAAVTPAPDPAPPSTPSTDPEDDDMPAFATGEIKPGDGAVTVVCTPPANLGSAGWGNVWFSLGCDFGDADVRVAIHTHGAGWSEIDQNIHVTAAGDRVNPHGGPLPTGVQKISIKRVGPNHDVPMSYLIEAAHR